MEKGSEPLEEPSSPVFTSLAAAFGMALGELVIAFGSERDVELALEHAWTVARATLLSAERSNL